MRIVCKECGDVLEPVHPNVVVCCACGKCALDGDSTYIKIPSIFTDDYKKIIKYIEILINDRTYTKPCAKTKSYEEILIENNNYAASFIINNGKDYDVCQLFKKDMAHDRHVLIDTWVRRDLYMSTVKSKDKEIADLKTEIERLKTRINAIYGRR